ncbi:MAG: RHS repeat-associated core domain-containing protein, partial [Polyangiaceae bacterium]
QVTHRYHVRSPEREIAIVTRTAQQEEIAYLHADHLGSVDVITDSSGAVTERRSYDAFGQRRNPTWGAPPPASFASSTTVGFTGHKAEDLGLIDMKGRMFDPRLGRFLTTDKVVSDRFFSQAWNPYSYVANSPLTYIDPTGWQGVPGGDDPVPVGPGGFIEVFVHGPPRIGPPPPPEDDPTDNAQIGVAGPPSDTDTTGSNPDPGTEPDDPDDSESWLDHPVVQTVGGFWSGTLLGLVPFAGTAEDLAEQGDLVDRGTPAAQRGKAIGLIVGGTYTMVSGAGGEILGGAATSTGVGAAVGVPAIVVSTGMVLGGAANVYTGVQSLMAGPKESGATTPRAPKPTVSGTGRARSQERLRQIAEDPKTSSADRGWIRQEQNAIERGQRSTIRNPPGKQLAHSRGREAAKGYDHVESPSNLQDQDLHKSQHKFDGGGRLNRERQ